MKTMSRDSQIILNIMRYQDKIDAVISSVDDESDVVNDKEKVELLIFYILKIFAMRKNFSGKTKKALTCFDDTKGNMVLSGMNFCYPTYSDSEIVTFAMTLSDPAVRDELSKQYELCIKESLKYHGD